MRMRLILDVDVINAGSESEARECAFRLASALTSSKTGRPSSGPRASVTGIQVESVEEKCNPVDFHDAVETSK